MAACYYKQPESVPLLIEAGADVNLNDNTGSSALMFACRYDQLFAIVSFLIESDADVNLIDNDGWSALMFACKYQQYNDGFF